MREAVHTLIGHDKDHAILMKQNILSTKELEKILLQSIKTCQEQAKQCVDLKGAELETLMQDVSARGSVLEHKLSELAYKVEMLCMQPQKDSIPALPHNRECETVESGDGALLTLGQLNKIHGDIVARRQHTVSCSVTKAHGDDFRDIRAADHEPVEDKSTA